MSANADHQGTQGKLGSHGDNGVEGEKGAKGARGATGAEGAVGSEGVRGKEGQKGAKGERGDKGPQGSPAKDGTKGPQGAQGKQGMQGKKGLAGATGAAGKKGLDGPAGEDGKQGKKGGKGVAGKEGKEGDKGKNGVKGDDGSGDDKDYIIVEVLSSASKDIGVQKPEASIKVDGLEKSPKKKGVNIVVVNQYDGKITGSATFDVSTDSGAESLNAYIESADDTPHGSVVILALQDEESGTTNISSKANKAFESIHLIGAESLTKMDISAPGATATTSPGKHGSFAIVGCKGIKHDWTTQAYSPEGMGPTRITIKIPKEPNDEREEALEIEKCQPEAGGVSWTNCRPKDIYEMQDSGKTIEWDLLSPAQIDLIAQKYSHEFVPWSSFGDKVWDKLDAYWGLKRKDQTV